METFEHAGLTCEIHWEEDGSFADPRDNANLGTMVCWHPDYYLGDYQIYNPEGRGAVENEFPAGSRFESLEILHRYLTLAQRAICVLPLSIYEHSGISMYIGGKHDYPFDSAGWDTTVVGFIYTTATRIEELCGPCKDCAGTGETERCVTDSGDYDPEKCPTCKGTGLYFSPDEMEKALRQEVDTYDSYLRGEIYWWCVRNDEGDMMESCGGYVGDIDYVEEEAKQAAEDLAKDIAVNTEPIDVAECLSKRR